MSAATAIQDCQPQLNDLYALVFGEDQQESPQSSPPPSGPQDDEAFVLDCMDAEWGGKFTRLYYGDTTGFISPSEADLAFCTLVAIRNGGDCAQVNRVFRLSQLFDQKWERDEYRDETLDKALAKAAEEALKRHPEPRSYTALEIAAIEFPDTDPVLLCAERGTLFDLVGKSKGGKSTLMLHGCRAVLMGEPFLDLSTKRVSILYLTEQTRRSFQKTLFTVGLDKEDDFHTFFRTDFRGMTWEQTCALARKEVIREGIGLLVVDTLSDWAGIENENDNAEALRILAPLREIAESGDVAVCTLRHTGYRRGGKDVVDSGRGASAYSGGPDVCCDLGPAGGKHPNRRQLRFAGRPDDLPAPTVIELVDGCYVSCYVSLGNSPNAQYEAARAFVLEQLPSDKAAALTEVEMENDVGVSRATLKRVLNDLEKENKVMLEKGVGSARTNQYGYWLASADNEHKDL